MIFRKYKILNRIILIIIPMLIGCYFILKSELNNLIVSDQIKEYEDSVVRDTFELSSFLGKLEDHENIDIGNITFYDSKCELKIGCEGNLNSIKELLKSLVEMDEVEDISELSIENNWCEILVVCNK